MSKDARPVKLGFQRDCIDVPLDFLQPTKPLAPGIKQTLKYLQIRATVQEVGLVEAIAISPNLDRPGSFVVLDGHMRLEALRDIGETHARCLVSTDDEGYTYNKRVNRLSVIQAHRMIVHAAEAGTSITRLAIALDVTESAIRNQFKLLDGICDEAVALLADKPASQGMFRTLRKVKAFRQIDIAQAMINLNNYSVTLALAMLQVTPAEQLEEKFASKAKRQGASETLQRMERELAALQTDTKLMDESYGPENLRLEIIKSHIRTLLENASVVRWLAKFQREYLQQLQIIAEMKQLAAD
jgi:ParB-like chromosome segregation protein Spo0J